ncbi:MAG: hypothetical protein ABI481_11275 [Pyrinomonadaceae bacterium]
MNKGKQRYLCRACRRFSSGEPRTTTKNGERKLRRAANDPSESRLIFELRAIAQRIHRTPTTADIMELSKKGRARSLDTYYVVFGSFQTGLKRARLKLQCRQEFSEHEKEHLLEELRVLRKRVKRPLLGRDVRGMTWV